MILILADSGPINYLIFIGHISVLSELAETVVLPASVVAELQHPAAVRTWASALPACAESRTALHPFEADDLSVADRDGISLAKELRAAVLLMDDRDARRHAAKLGVTTMATVGLLEIAVARGLVDLADALERLRRTSCWWRMRSLKTRCAALKSGDAEPGIMSTTPAEPASPWHKRFGSERGRETNRGFSNGMLHARPRSRAA